MLKQVQHDKKAFTMAEILLSLTIIGVVAAITLPSLTGNINERTWNTQRKALYARMSQAVALMPALNGYGTYETVSASGSTSVNDNVAETFITAGLSKVLKINNICDPEHVFDCGLSSKINTLGANNIDLPRKFYDLNHGITSVYNGSMRIKNTSAAAFETANGESVLTFYNPNCTAKDVVYAGSDDAGNPGSYVKQHLCVNFVFDLNGSKGPNTVGKDIGIMSVIYSSDSNVVMPIPTRILSEDFSQLEAARECRELDADSRLPNVEELISMYYNSNLLDWSQGGFWSSTVIDSETAYSFGFNHGMKYSKDRTLETQVQCVKR